MVGTHQLRHKLSKLVEYLITSNKDIRHLNLLAAIRALLDFARRHGVSSSISGEFLKAVGGIERSLYGTTRTTSVVCVKRIIGNRIFSKQWQRYEESIDKRAKPTKCTQ